MAGISNGRGTGPDAAEQGTGSETVDPAAADSAGHPWAGRTFDAHDTAFAEDDGLADAQLHGRGDHRAFARDVDDADELLAAARAQHGVVDEDGGLWHRTLDELDACAAAYTAYALAAGHGTWVGDPEEGVIVLPAAELLDRYEKLPPPSRAALVQ